MLNEIRTALDDVFDRSDNDWTQSDWTREVKTALCAACQQFNPDLGVCASDAIGDVAHEGEWLYDVSAQLYDDELYLIRSALAAECEWSGATAIYRDFQKLLLARADFRVMVFDGNQQPFHDELFQTFARYIGRCEHSETGDAWLFAAYTDDGFVYHQIRAFQTAGPG